MLRQAFGFHELALAEVTERHERPRCDTYNDYYFIVVYAAELQEKQFHPRELNLFWGKNYLVTIHRRPEAVVAVLEDTRRRWEQHDGRKVLGIACLVHTLFERIVDGYFLVQDRFRERMEGIEQSILEGGDTAAADLYRLRKDLLRCPDCSPRPPTCWPKCSAGSGASQPSSGPISAMCRTTPRTCWPRWTPTAIC